MKDVFLQRERNEISFEHVPGSVCIGETEGTLQEFLQFMRDDFGARGISPKELPLVVEAKE